MYTKRKRSASPQKTTSTRKFDFQRRPEGTGIQLISLTTPDNVEVFRSDGQIHDASALQELIARHSA